MYYFIPDPSETTIQNEFSNQLAAEIDSEHMTEDALQEKIQSCLEHVVPEAFKETFKQVRSTIKQEQNLARGFNKRNYARWQAGFDIAHAMIMISQDLGTFILQTQEADLECPAKFQSIISLHAKSLRVGREVLCLLENGFADGALGRWRTLHETATIASFLSANNENIAERFIHAREVQSYKAARQYIKFQQRANLMPFGEAELERLRVRCEKIISEHGAEMKTDWGWAAPALNNNQPTFAQIEEARGLDHWRPRYKWASEDSHSNYKPHETHLALSEATEPLLLAGRTDSGMIDPAQMLGCSLHLAASSLLSLKQNIDIYVWLEVMGILNNKLSEALFSVERSHP